MAEQYLNRIVSYYDKFGREMKDKSLELRQEYESTKLREVLNNGSITEAERVKISNFFNNFVKYYVEKKKAKKEVRELVQALKSQKSDIDSWLRGRTHDTGGRAHMLPQIESMRVTSGVRTSQPASRVSGGRGSAKHKGERREQKERTEGELQHLQYLVENLQSQLQEKDKQIYDLSHRYQGKSLEQQNHLLQQKVLEKEMLVKQQAIKLQDLSHRLSSEMNSKISANETSLENISIKNRPMTIAGEYQTLFSTEWTDAKNAIDKLWPTQELEKLQYLCSIFLEAYKLSASIKDKCHVYLYEPSMEWKQEITDNGAGVSLGVKQVVFDYWKARGRKLSVTEDMVKEILQRGVKNKKQLPKSLNSVPPVNTYVREVFNLTWNMVIQKPAMTLDISGVGERWRGEGQQELAWGSKDPTCGKVQCYVYPSLKHGDQVMVRGKVLVL